MNLDLAAAIMASAERLGADPIDLATTISYETGGTFDPWQAGPTTQWGQHRGLIQWGEPQRAQYGVYEGMPVAEQLQSVERYLTDAGWQPGMGLMDMYSAVNAGRVGRYGASDANNGGAPGTVADKVNNQMGGHRNNALRLLGMGGNTPAPSAPLSFGSAARPSTLGDMFTPQEGLAAGRSIEPAPGVPRPQARPAEVQEARARTDQARRQALFADLGSYFG